VWKEVPDKVGNVKVEWGPALASDTLKYAPRVPANYEAEKAQGFSAKTYSLQLVATLDKFPDMDVIMKVEKTIQLTIKAHPCKFTEIVPVSNLKRSFSATRFWSGTTRTIAEMDYQIIATKTHSTPGGPTE